MRPEEELMRINQAKKRKRNSSDGEKIQRHSEGEVGDFREKGTE